MPTAGHQRYLPFNRGPKVCPAEGERVSVTVVNCGSLEQQDGHLTPQSTTLGDELRLALSGYQIGRRTKGLNACSITYEHRPSWVLSTARRPGRNAEIGVPGLVFKYARDRLQMR